MNVDEEDRELLSMQEDRELLSMETTSLAKQGGTT